MRCEEAENNFAEYLKGDLSSESRFPEHLAQCVRCRNQVEELRKVWAELESIAVPATPSVMRANLLAAIAEAKLEPAQPLSPTRRTPMPYIIKPVLVLLLSVGAAFFVGRSLEQPAIDNDAHYRGSPNAKVTLVEYVDYECPPCAVYNPIVNAVLQRYGNNVRLEFHHYPLTRIHPNALKAAVAAEAAGLQGHYWEMHDLLLLSQEKWAHTDNAEQEFAKFAISIGLDTNRFLEASNSPELRQRVMADLERGQKNSVRAVPAFFLNGRKIEPAPTTAEGFFVLIDAELQPGK